MATETSAEFIEDPGRFELTDHFTTTDDEYSQTEYSVRLYETENSSEGVFFKSLYFPEGHVHICGRYTTFNENQWRINEIAAYDESVGYIQNLNEIAGYFTLTGFLNDFQLHIWDEARVLEWDFYEHVHLEYLFLRGNASNGGAAGCASPSAAQW